MTAFFDTLTIATQLKAAGFTEAQAEAMTIAFRDSREAELSHLATKADINELRTATKADINELRAATTSDINELRAATKAELNEFRTVMKAELSEFRAVTTELAAAMKFDINELRTSTKADITELRSEIVSAKSELQAEFREGQLRHDAKIEAGKADTIKWVVSAMAFQTIVIVGAVIAPARLFQP